MRGNGEHQDRRARTDHPRDQRQSANPTEDTLLRATVIELKRLEISPREVALDGGFNVGRTPPSAGALPARAGVHRGPPRTRLPTNAATPSSVPHRHPGQDQPPQTQLRAAPQPAEEPTGCRPGPDGRSSPTTLTPRDPNQLKHSPSSTKSNTICPGTAASDDAAVLVPALGHLSEEATSRILRDAAARCHRALACGVLPSASACARMPRRGSYSVRGAATTRLGRQLSPRCSPAALAQ
jgi:hypothetical protein